MKIETFKLGRHATMTAYLQNPEISFGQTTTFPGLIICPGGAYLIHATKEAEPVAMEFMARGFNCFVLKYSTVFDRHHPEKEPDKDLRYPTPVLELMEAIHLIRAHAKEWHVDANNLFAMGFSAGGHVCASVGTRWKDPNLISQLDFIPGNDELRLKGIVLGYPMLAANTSSFSSSVSPADQKDVSQVLWGTSTPTKEQFDSVSLTRYIDKNTIPAFIWHTIDDDVVDSINSLEFIQKMMEAGNDCELHMYREGGHGLGLAKQNPTVSDWTNQAERWMKEQISKERKGVKSK